MTLLRIGPVGITRSRFAISPLMEMVGALIALHRGATPAWLAHESDKSVAVQFRAWLAGDDVAAGLLSLISATKFLPDTITPPPRGGMDTRLADELAEVAAFSDDAVRATVALSVEASWQPQELAWLARKNLGRRLAEALTEGWARFVEPDWARRRAILERDVMHRAGILAAYGWQRTVIGMTRHASWAGEDAIRFDDKDRADRHIGDDGLVFVPYTSGGGWWTCERPDGFALVYPAFGPAGSVESTMDDPLAGLLGGGRARVLRELARSATSSQLAMVLGLSLGTVSAHLAVLRETGMISGHRSGRHVVYRLTDRGVALLELMQGA